MGLFDIFHFGFLCLILHSWQECIKQMKEVNSDEK